MDYLAKKNELKSLKEDFRRLLLVRKIQHLEEQQEGLFRQQEPNRTCRRK